MLSHPVILTTFHDTIIITVKNCLQKQIWTTEGCHGWFKKIINTFDCWCLFCLSLENNENKNLFSILMQTQCLSRSLSLFFNRISSQLHFAARTSEKTDHKMYRRSRIPEARNWRKLWHFIFPNEICLFCYSILTVLRSEWELVCSISYTSVSFIKTQIIIKFIMYAIVLPWCIKCIYILVNIVQF